MGLKGKTGEAVNELQIFKKEEFGEIRTVTIKNEPWFVGKDVAMALGYERATKAIQDHVNEEDKDEIPIQDSIGRMQKTPIINESGLYALIFGSKLESAKRFKKWVTSEVLPSIRKTGGYISGNGNIDELSPQMQLLMQMVNNMAEKELADKERDRQIALAQETAEKAVETTEKIKEEFTTPFENWRDDINRKVRQIAKNSEIPYQQLFSQMYEELERNGYNLAQRQRNKRARMMEAGCKKTDIDRETSKIAVIEEDKKAKRIFGDIVARYAVKYIS